MGLTQDFNKALHFTNEIDHITTSILANFLSLLLGRSDWGKKKKKEMEARIPDSWEVQGLL